MTDFSNRIPSGLSANQIKRIDRRDILPASVKGSALPQDLLKNSSVTTGPFSFDTGTGINITSQTISSENARIGLVPFMIAFFDSDTYSGIDPGTNQIPWDTTVGDYDIYGPMAMPNFTVNSKRYYVSSSGNNIYFATDGNDVVYKTNIVNNSGGTQTVQYILQTRYLLSRGGGV